MTASRLPPRAVAGVYRSAPQPHRATMLEMRRRILRIVPHAEEVLSYGIAAFKVNGNIVGGLLAAKHHVGFYPFSGTVLSMFPHELRGFSTTKSALHVPIDKPLSSALLKKLISARISQDTSKSARGDDEWRSLGLAAPARRALANAKIYHLRDLRAWREVDVKTLHGIGGNALAELKRAMKRARITFRPG
jgi:uncharacterized protein YdhG (YjbR/CyaY superfamily)